LEPVASAGCFTAEAALVTVEVSMDMMLSFKQ
jgi:hypothetical protein